MSVPPKNIILLYIFYVMTHCTSIKTLQISQIGHIGIFLITFPLIALKVLAFATDGLSIDVSVLQPCQAAQSRSNQTGTHVAEQLRASRKPRENHVLNNLSHQRYQAGVTLRVIKKGTSSFKRKIFSVTINTKLILESHRCQMRIDTNSGNVGQREEFIV